MSQIRTHNVSGDRHLLQMITTAPCDQNVAKKSQYAA